MKETAVRVRDQV